MSHTAPRPTHNRHAPKTQTTSPKTPQIHAFSPKWSAFWAIPCPAPVDWRGWKAPEGPEGLAAAPMGGGGAWPGIETTHRTRKQRPGTTGVEGTGGTGGPGCGARGRWRGLAGLRDDAPIGAPAPQVWRAPEGPEGTGGLRGAAPNEVRTPSLAGGRGLRSPKHPWRPTTTMTRPTRCAAHAGTGRGSG